MYTNLRKGHGAVCTRSGPCFMAEALLLWTVHNRVSPNSHPLPGTVLSRAEGSSPLPFQKSMHLMTGHCRARKIRAPYLHWWSLQKVIVKSLETGPWDHLSCCCVCIAFPPLPLSNPSFLTLLHTNLLQTLVYEDYR